MSWVGRAIVTLAVLAGIIGMHGLDSSLDSMAVMSPHPSTSLTTTAGMASSDVHAQSAAERSVQPSCGQDHCLAMLRTPAQLHAPVQVAAWQAAPAGCATSTGPQHRATLRAPPPTSSLTLLCVSRT
jgi:hypothetical protein